MAAKKGTYKKISGEEGFRILAKAFYEASQISFSLVFYPVVLLLLAVWLDKKLGTTPLFILAGVVSGVVVGIYKATRIKLQVKSKNRTIQK